MCYKRGRAREKREGEGLGTMMQMRQQKEVVWMGHPGEY